MTASTNNGTNRTELLMPAQTPPTVVPQESVQLDESVQQVLTAASQDSKDMLQQVSELIGTGAGEGSFTDTVTFVVEPNAQKLIIQRQVQFTRD